MEFRYRAMVECLGEVEEMGGIMNATACNRKT